MTTTGGIASFAMSSLRRSPAHRRAQALPFSPRGLRHSHITIRNRLDPPCPIRARRQGRARFAGCSFHSQALTPPRGSGSWFSWSLLREAGPQGRLPAAKTMATLRRIGAAQSPRSGRSTAEQPRSGLTATGRCGPGLKMCESRSLAGEGGRRSRPDEGAARPLPSNPSSAGGEGRVSGPDSRSPAGSGGSSGASLACGGRDMRPSAA